MEECYILELVACSRDCGAACTQLESGANLLAPAVPAARAPTHALPLPEGPLVLLNQAVLVPTGRASPGSPTMWAGDYKDNDTKTLYGWLRM